MSYQHIYFSINIQSINNEYLKNNVLSTRNMKTINGMQRIRDHLEKN
jgi:hypothetical protein